MGLSGLLLTNYVSPYEEEEMDGELILTMHHHDGYFLYIFLLTIPLLLLLLLLQFLISIYIYN